ncbi:MAG: DNA internalization-related competence protein ComEC/Rec2 [Pseudomonadota bacterium]|nr:DNA internalization-related competence protein ComEC/Rec2 [Pseudomonadota bacterium]
MGWWIAALAMVAGCWLGVLWPLCVILFAVLCCRRWRGWLLLPGLAFMAGVMQLQWGIGQQLPDALDGEVLPFEARVVALPQTVHEYRFGRWRWRQALLLEVSGNDAWPGIHRVRVNYYDPPQPVRAGERARIVVKLKAGRGQFNATGADLARRDLAQGIHARGSIRQWHRLSQGRGFLRWREQLSASLAARLQNSPVGASVVPALIVGDRSRLTPQQWQVFQATGAAHLLAISGLHIALVAGLAGWLGRWCLMPLCQRLVPALQRYTLQQLAWCPAMLAAVGYSAMAGFSLPTLRAVTMLAVVAISSCLRQPFSLWRSLAMALCVVLLVFPLSALSESLWLSFGAVAAIGWLAMGQGSRRLIVLLPAVMSVLGAVLFEQWSLSAPLANIVLIPLYSFLVIPLALCGALADCSVLLHGAATGIELSAWLMEELADTLVLPGLPLPGAWAGTCLMVAVAMLMMPGLPFPRRLLPLFLIPWLAQRPAPLPAGEWELTVFDVGQGLALAVRTREHLLLYDTGASWPGGSMAASIVVPWLNRFGLVPDRIVVSHGDNDHAGGLRAILPMMAESRAVLSGEPERVAGSSPCHAGQQWLWDGVRFRVLWPRQGDGNARGNDASCVLHIEGRNLSLLLPGDITRESEYPLLGQWPQSDLVVLAHHGSRSSTSAAFLRDTSPQWAVASAGYRHHFGHPHAQVLERLRASGVTVLRTDESGMIVFRRGDADNVPLITKWRQSHARPWHKPAGWRFW